MNLNTNFVDINTIKVNESLKYKNNDFTKLEDKQLKKVCNDFESFFMQQLLDISLKNTKVSGEGTGSDIIKGMYTNSIAQQSKGAVGISNMLYEFLTQNNK